MSAAHTISPFSPHPLYVMAKPVGARCNLGCSYCYYLEKESMGGGGATDMSDEILELFIRQYIECQPADSVLFTWHGGEPLLRSRSFYEKVIRLQKRYAHGRAIDNAIQTNGTLLDDDWARFFADNEWLVGLSLDGPADMHDAFRCDKGGRSTWSRVMRGVDFLNARNVMWNAMAVANSVTAREPLRFYRFFRDIGCRFLQFTPVVERLVDVNGGHRLASLADTSGTLAAHSVTPRLWGSFLCGIFDEWLSRDVGTVFVQLFDATLANWMGVAPGLCSLSRQCGHVGVLEHNGDMYSCDHFVFPQYRLGNIAGQSVGQLMNTPQQHAFARMKMDGLPGQCRICPWLFCCNGGCPRNRFAADTNNEPGLNYLCSGYRRFFDHSADAMFRMKELVEAGRDAAEVMLCHRQES